MASVFQSFVIFIFFGASIFAGCGTDVSVHPKTYGTELISGDASAVDDSPFKILGYNTYRHPFKAIFQPQISVVLKPNYFFTGLGFRMVKLDNTEAPYDVRLYGRKLTSDGHFGKEYAFEKRLFTPQMIVHFSTESVVIGGIKIEVENAMIIGADYRRAKFGRPVLEYDENITTSGTVGSDAVRDRHYISLPDGYIMTGIALASGDPNIKFTGLELITATFGFRGGN